MDTIRVISDGVQTRWTSFVDDHHDNALLIWVLIPYFCSLSANLIISAIGEILDRLSPQSYYNKYKIVYKQGKNALGSIISPISYSFALSLAK